nr:substrate binding domain-containing protein [Salinarimonas ramus]
MSVPIALGLDRITPLMPAYLERHPKVSLDLRLTDDVENLIDARIDLAVRMGRPTDSSLMHRRLCGLQRIVVATPELVARFGMPKRPADLARMPCVAWDGSREHLNRWKFVEDGEIVTFHAESRFRSNQGMSLYLMCLGGFGVMRVAEHLARPAVADGRLVQLLADRLLVDNTEIYALFLPDRRIVPRIRSFVEFMVEAFREPDWEIVGRGERSGA